jgi:hypothetical protein
MIVKLYSVTHKCILAYSIRGAGSNHRLAFLTFDPRDVVSLKPKKKTMLRVAATQHNAMAEFGGWVESARDVLCVWLQFFFGTFVPGGPNPGRILQTGASCSARAVGWGGVTARALLRGVHSIWATAIKSLTSWKHVAL